MDKKPNIIFILSDQHNASIMGNAGDNFVRTPNLDKLSKKGINFNNCYCGSPLCVPSRGSLLTSQYPLDCGTLNNQHSIFTDRATIAHVMNIAGYETVLSGRMHFTGADQHHGFEKRLVGDITPSYQGRDVEFIDSLGNLDEMFKQKPSGLFRAGAGSCAIDHYDNDVLAETIKFIETRKDERPLFLTVGLASPHPPFVVSEELYNYYYNLLPEIEYKEDIDENLHPALKKWLNTRKIYDIPKEWIKKSRAAYYGLVDYMDSVVGKIIESIEKNFDLDNTIIVYCSDHGEGMGNHKMWWKGFFYDDSARVPMIVSCPKIFESDVVKNDLVSLLDIAPTFIEIGEAPKLPKMVGQSLLKVLEGKESISSERSVISQMGTYPSGDQPSAMIKKGDYKLISYHGYEEVSLFNLKEDKNEDRELGNKKEYEEIKNSLLKELNLIWNSDKAKEYCDYSDEHFDLLAKWSRTTKMEIVKQWKGRPEDNYLLNERENLK